MSGKCSKCPPLQFSFTPIYSYVGTLLTTKNTRFHKNKYTEQKKDHSYNIIRTNKIEHKQ